MAEILKNQLLEIENIISFRGKVCLTDIEQIGKEMEEKAKQLGAKRIDNPITATYGVEGDLLDIEILLPIDKKIENFDKYIYKDRIKIVNALVAKHHGNPAALQNTCNELNQYILEKQLTPITAGYNVTRKINPANIQDTEVDVYVGISPNIL
jgi:effector-binding domain-containing protein